MDYKKFNGKRIEDVATRLEDIIITTIKMMKVISSTRGLVTLTILNILG